MSFVIRLRCVMRFQASFFHRALYVKTHRQQIPNNSGSLHRLGGSSFGHKKSRSRSAGKHGSESLPWFSGPVERVASGVFLVDAGLRPPKVAWACWGGYPRRLFDCFGLSKSITCNPHLPDSGWGESK